MIVSNAVCVLGFEYTIRYLQAFKYQSRDFCFESVEWRQNDSFRQLAHSLAFCIWLLVINFFLY